MNPPPAFPFRRVDFSQAPFLTIWETTRSCALACRHCRAEAILGRDPRELTTEEGKDLIDQVAEMGTPILIFSGGDALNRDDLEELIAHAKNKSLRTGTIPAATSGLSRERILSLKAAGIDQIAFSLDAPNAALHDGFRGIDGAFDKTILAAGWVREAGVPLQINTCFGAWNYSLLEDMVGLVKELGVSFWEVFFLIPMGRGSEMQSLSAEQFESAFKRLHQLSREEDFVVKLTEAPHYRRYVIKEENKRGSAGAAGRIKQVLARERGVKGGMGLSPEAVNSGKGFMFIDHIGNICPSGFLPVAAGQIRRQPLAEVYRNAPLFVQLRDPEQLKGKCGRCEFAAICAGSRARAWAVTGDPLAADPFCAYEPEEKVASAE